jgi:hypothetical protein
MDCEIKFDGLRAVFVVEDGEARAVTLNRAPIPALRKRVAKWLKPGAHGKRSPSPRRRRTSSRYCARATGRLKA